MDQESTKTVKHVSLLFSLGFLLAVPLAALYTGETHVFQDWIRILTSPCPLVTDYYALGSLPATFLNAGLCGGVCTMMFYLLKGNYGPANWAGYFLVVAHCFYGLNFLNMWFPILGIYIYCLGTKVRFRDTLDVAMMSTAFGPFMSELLWRYPLETQIPITLGSFSFNLMGVLLCILLGIFLGYAVPAMLPGAKLLHKGYNLYNGGLAFGLLGLLIYSFMYRTMGLQTAPQVVLVNETYASHGNSYMGFCNAFFCIIFAICLLRGFYLNGKSFKGYRTLMKEVGRNTNFLEKFGAGLTWINLGFYGLMMVLYFDVIILFTNGAGWTGATCGVTLAAITFAASGQHPSNVWSILVGYVTLYVFVYVICMLFGREMAWTLSTQGYINGVAFATGLCPFAGYYGIDVGILAGFMSATMCTTTSIMHGGFMLYNGGLTAGITALILTPMLARYYRGRLRVKKEDESDD